ncbi:hypothetical protein [Armatimonas sp.]|uniref:hypothetical protein n=1 Tax=Armatimonas sp. TaxID=1872638 RepID=UPI00286B7CB0|nr:hypothetical protein [Armatimonas sp.]
MASITIGKRERQMDWWPKRKAKTVQSAQTTHADRASRRPELIEAAPLFGELADALDELYIAAEKRLAQPDFNYDRQAGCNIGDHLARAAWMMGAYLTQGLCCISRH